MANYADDNAPYCTGLKISDVLIKVENAAETLFQWFKDNTMKANRDKYHLFINNTKESFQIKIGNETVRNSKYEKLLGFKIDHELNFKIAVQSETKFSLTNSILQDIWSKKTDFELFHNITFFLLSDSMNI